MSCWFFSPLVQINAGANNLRNLREISRKLSTVSTESIPRSSLLCVRMVSSHTTTRQILYISFDASRRHRPVEMLLLTSCDEGGHNQRVLALGPLPLTEPMPQGQKSTSYQTRPSRIIATAFGHLSSDPSFNPCPAGKLAFVSNRVPTSSFVRGMARKMQKPTHQERRRQGEGTSTTQQRNKQKYLQQQGPAKGRRRQPRWRKGRQQQASWLGCFG